MNRTNLAYYFTDYRTKHLHDTGPPLSSIKFHLKLLTFIEDIKKKMKISIFGLFLDILCLEEARDLNQDYPQLLFDTVKGPSLDIFVAHKD